MTEQEIQDRWLVDVVLNARKVDSEYEQDWHSIWIGFVVALGRIDLVDYKNYMRLGFALEGHAP